MSVKQDLAMLSCRCLNCQNDFLLTGYHCKGGIVYSSFECGCGRHIKIKEDRIPSESRTNISKMSLEMLRSWVPRVEPFLIYLNKELGKAKQPCKEAAELTREEYC